jgi:hypothetical protein
MIYALIGCCSCDRRTVPIHLRKENLDFGALAGGQELAVPAQSFAQAEFLQGRGGKPRHEPAQFLQGLPGGLLQVVQDFQAPLAALQDRAQGAQGVDDPGNIFYSTPSKKFLLNVFYY